MAIFLVSGDDAHANDERSASFVTLRGRTSSRTSVSSVMRARTDSVFETLHAIEPVTHRFNLLGIAVSQGIFAPEVAVGAVATLGCLDLFKWGLDRHFVQPQPTMAVARLTARVAPTTTERHWHTLSIHCRSCAW
jgi:hypothetical protein